MQKKEFTQGVSIVICAKNELDNLQKFFPYWVKQKYSCFEIIIVNDQSTDGSAIYLDKLSKENDLLKVVHIPLNENKNLLGKRYALKKGIEATKFDYILLTDADCKPASVYWVQEMAKAFANKEIDVVLGYSPYFFENSLLNKLIQLETQLTALQYIGFAQAKKAYMGVGRNMAYRKSALQSIFFEKSNKSIGGDDDLLMQQVVKHDNTAYTIVLNSMVWSKPSSSFAQWLKQKKRHLGAGLFYPWRIKVELGLFNFLHLLFIGLSIYQIIFSTKWWVLLFLLQAILLYFINKKVFTAQNKLKAIEFMVLHSIYWLFYIIFAVAVFL